MPSFKTAQALPAPETQKALSLPMAALILGAVSQVEKVMEIVDRVLVQLESNPAKLVVGPDLTACQMGPGALADSCASGIHLQNLQLAPDGCRPLPSGVVYERSV
jgi:hypothetical protein